MTITVGASGLFVNPIDVIRIVQPLVAGNNIITDNAGSAAREIQIRNTATGAQVTFTLVSESTNSFVIFVPVAVASVTISTDV